MSSPIGPNTIDSHMTLGPGTLIFGDVGSQSEFSAMISSITVTPTTEAGESYVVLSGDVSPGEETTTWSLDFTTYQNLRANGVIDWAFKNRAKRVPFEFRPVDGETSAQITGTVIVRPIAIGGTIGQKNTSDVSWPLVGEPTITAEA